LKALGSIVSSVFNSNHRRLEILDFEGDIPIIEYNIDKKYLLRIRPIESFIEEKISFIEMPDLFMVDE
jgi:uncharacterized protein with PhoU and TrkA domain